MKVGQFVMGFDAVVSLELAPLARTAEMEGLDVVMKLPQMSVVGVI